MARLIEIQLKSGIETRTLPPGFRATLESEYAERYLVSLGANPTRENIEFIKKNASIKDSVLLPVWTKEVLVILPNRNDDPDKIDLQDVFKTDVAVVEEGYSDNQLKSTKNVMNANDRRKSAKELISIKPLQYVREKKFNWRMKNVCGCLQPLVESLSITDIQHKDFLKLHYKSNLNEGDLIDSVNKFKSCMKSFVPFLKDDVNHVVSNMLIKFLSSGPFLEFCELFYNSCYQKVMFGCAELAIVRLEKLDLNVYSKITSKMEGVWSTDPTSMPPQVRSMLSEDDESSLMSCYEKCMATLQSKMGLSRFTLRAGNQTIVYASCFIVFDLLKSKYNWLNSNRTFSAELNLLRKYTVKLLVDMMTDLVDPSRVYPMEFLFDYGSNVPQLEKNFIDRKSFKNRRGRQFTTSLPLRAVFCEHATSVGTRKMLQMNRIDPASTSSRPGTSVSKALSNVGKRKETEVPLNRNPLWEIQEIFGSFDERMRQKKMGMYPFSCDDAVEAALSAEGASLSESKSKALVEFADLFADESSLLDPKLAPEKKLVVLQSVLEKSRAAYEKKSKDSKTVSSQDPRVGLLSPVSRFNSTWSSKSTRTGMRELANDNTKYPTRPPSRDTPIIDVLNYKYKPRTATAL